jgi:hypothetical protein
VRTWCNVIKDPEHIGCPIKILKRQTWKGNSPKVKILFTSNNFLKLSLINFKDIMKDFIMNMQKARTSHIFIHFHNKIN